MSADTDDLAGAGVTCPPGSVDVTEDGERCRVEWHPTSRVTRTALFRIITDDGVALLQHVREVRTNRSGPPTDATLDDCPTIADVPRCYRATMEDMGLVPTTEVR